MKKLISLSMLLLLLLTGCTTYIDNIDSLKIDVVQSKTTLTIDPQGVQDEFYLNVTLLTNTDEVTLYKYNIQYNEVNSQIAKEGNFMLLDKVSETKKFYVSLMTPDSFEYLKLHTMITANVKLFFKTKSGVIVTKEVQIPILYTTQTK